MEGTIRPNTHQNGSEILGGQGDKIVVVSSVVPKAFLSISVVKCRNPGYGSFGRKSVLFVTECF